jgi:hypothetical protein
MSLDTSLDIIKVLKQTVIEKNGVKLEQIPFVMSELKIQLSNDLKIFFNIFIKIDSYENMKKQFSKDTIKNNFTVNALNNNITFNEEVNKSSQEYISQEYISQEYIYSKNLQHGSFNKLSEYTIYSDKYALRQSILPNTTIEDNFNSFYENLKHIILYLLMCRYNSQIKLIPKPIGMGWYNNSICFLSEAGEIDLFQYINTRLYMINKDGNIDFDSIDNTKILEKICFKIYRDLFIINQVPGMELCFMHGDMKSENIVLTKLLQPLLIDFGFSRFVIDDVLFIKTNDLKNENKKAIYLNIIKYKQKYSDTFYILILDFLMLLYYIIYGFKIKLFDYDLPNPKWILQYNKLLSLYTAINLYDQYQKYKENGRLSYLLIGYEIDQFKYINEKDYYYKITPKDLLKFLIPSENSKKNIEYMVQSYYKKYLKYKNKYINLKNL